MNKEQAQTLLAGLGDNATEIANSLRAEGITGIPKEATHCPISCFLQKHGAEYPATTAFTIVLGVDELGDEITMDTPQPVVRFVRLFDIYVFSDLIKR